MRIDLIIKVRNVSKKNMAIETRVAEVLGMAVIVWPASLRSEQLSIWV